MTKIDKVIDVVSHELHVHRDVMLSPQRDDRTVLCRQIAMWLCRKLISQMSYERIGRAFRRHHATVMHACDVVPNKIAGDPQLGMKVIDIIYKINHKRQDILP